VAKLILMSMLIASLWIPLVVAMKPDARRGMKLARKRFFVFLAVWVLAVLYVVPRL
jgi:hypothetical protein